MVIEVGTEPDKAKARRKRQGAMIRKLREMRGIAIQELSDAIGVTPGAVSQWETGRFTPRPHIQVAICRALDVPHSTIFSLDQEVA